MAQPQYPFQLTISSMCGSLLHQVPWKYTAAKDVNSGPCPETMLHRLYGSRRDPKNSLSISRRKLHATELLPGNCWMWDETFLLSDDWRHTCHMQLGVPRKVCEQPRVPGILSFSCTAAIWINASKPYSLIPSTP